MSSLRHGPPLALHGYLDKEGRKLHGRKTRYFKLQDSALFNHRRKDSLPTWGISLIDSRVTLGHKGEAIMLQLFDGKKLALFPHSRVDCDKWADLLQRASRRKIGNFYRVTGLIGMGSFAEVRVGYDKTTGEQVAIKVMKKNKRDTELMRSVECEMNFVSKCIDHVNVVRTYDCFDTRDNMFLVMEYMPGGMLYDLLANEGYFLERNASSIMKDILQGVACLHDHDIVHRDIKPENILAMNKEWPLKVKLADFGLADFVLETSFGDKCTNGMYGTPFFVAPEVIRGETYGPAVDCWSCGVLLYNILSGALPFDGNNIKEVLRRVRSGKYEFPEAEWRDISDDAKDLVAGLLELDPKKRLTAHAALQHNWIVSTELSTRPIRNDRSALGTQQRRARMSSMAIDDVKGALDLDDDSDDGDDGAAQLSVEFAAAEAQAGFHTPSPMAPPPQLAPPMHSHSVPVQHVQHPPAFEAHIPVAAVAAGRQPTGRHDSDMGSATAAGYGAAFGDEYLPHQHQPPAEPFTLPGAAPLAHAAGDDSLLPSRSTSATVDVYGVADAGAGPLDGVSSVSEAVFDHSAPLAATAASQPVSSSAGHHGRRHHRRSGRERSHRTTSTGATAAGVASAAVASGTAPGVFPTAPHGGRGGGAGGRQHRRKHHSSSPTSTSAVAAEASLVSLNAPSTADLAPSCSDGGPFFPSAAAATTAADGADAAPVTHNVRYPSPGGMGVYDFSGLASAASVGNGTDGGRTGSLVSGVRVDSTASSVDSVALGYAGGGGGDGLDHHGSLVSTAGGAPRPLGHLPAGLGANGLGDGGGGGPSVGGPAGGGGAAGGGGGGAAANNPFYLPDVFSVKSIRAKRAKRALARQQQGGGGADRAGHAKVSSSAAKGHGRTRGGGGTSSAAPGGSHRHPPPVPST
ncbi:hypothetical protein I4F81_005658 [Pyropia yezoensis]|uniref:Uncharacterized protein n=1 Tax=Pyropia yezoensis TaxID=2788 RepID=A0ACC3BZ01_PYRYE|nr:hypothetical protein I4F81_005658 [Neopyropia yezoensis]